MNIISFLSELRQRNISIRLNGDDLKVSGLKKDTSADIIDQLKRNKAELLSFLRRSEQSAWTGIPAAPVMETYPISHAQRQLWLIDQTTSVGATYNMFFKQEWNNILDFGVLEQSMQFLLQRHEILRTVFTQVNGEVRQKIQDAAACGFSVRRLAHAGEHKEEFLLGVERGEAAHVFDLTTGPLLRMLVVSFGDKQHVLLFTMHHIISDGWSKQVLFQELAAAYIDTRNKKIPGLPPLGVQYKDFACWQQLPATQREMKKHAAYWFSVLSPERALIDLPADNRRPAIKTYHGATVQLKLSLHVLQQITELCQQYNCRIFSVMTAVFKTLLYHYTNEPDILAGMPVSGRIYPELQNQVGYYVNMVVLRTNMNQAHSFEQLVMQVEENMHAAYDHQEYPFDKLLDDLDVRHDASRAPLFDLMINYDKHSTLLFEQSGPDAAPMAVSKFDLEADFIEYSDGLLVGFTYNKALFTQERIERMCRHFECLLLNALDNPGAELSSLEYVPDYERSVIKTFNYTYAWFAKQKTIIELLEQQVKTTPGNLALAFEDTAISYQSFNERVNSAAHYLRDVHAVKPGDRIGVMMERSERMVLAIYAIIKAGAAYVPIDAAYPLQRIQYMVQDSEAKLVLTSGAVAAPAGCVAVNWDEIKFEEFPVHNPELVNTPDDPVYMIYTSGSTGQPKAVLVQHAALNNFCQWATDLIYRPAGRALRALLNGTINFDASVELLFPPLLNGSSLHIVPQKIKDNPYELLKTVEKYGIEVMDLIPSHMHLLLQVATENNIQPASIQYVVTGGELLQQETRDLFFSVMPGATIVNGYGPTEACVNTSYCLLDAGSGAGANCIGVPLPNMRVHILDTQQRETGIGIWGELFISGVGLAAGYWKREGLTSEKFILHPVFGRLYRSGDIARWNEKAELEFGGRADNQVKIRGFRIEMGEIESAIQSHAAVEEAVVVLGEHETKLIAVVCWRNGVEQVQQLNTHLSALLPKYMVPEQFIAVERIPRTSNGKLDRRALQHQGSGVVANTAGYIGAQNKIEEQLVLIWQELLDTRSIDVSDNFFELGGHSLKAMRMVSRLCREFNLSITVKDIFQHDTIQKLARFIEQQQSTSVYRGIEPVSAAEFYPLSPGQRSLWLAVQHEEAEAAYNMVSGYQWLQPLNAEAYAKAWQLLVQRHEVLRTVFVMHEGEVWQQVQDEPENSLHIVDCTQLTPAEQQQQLEKTLQAAQRHRYDLAKGPLVRLTVMKLGTAHYEMILGIHHIISDAWSLQVMQQELMEIYNGKALPALRIQFKDYAAWQTSRQLDGHRNYWLQQLGGELTVPELPADRPRGAKRSYHGRIFIHQPGEELLQSLQAFARQQQCSMYTVLMAAVNLLLFKYTGQHDLIVGVPSAGRENEELEKQLGYFVNTLAVRSKLQPGESAGQFVLKVKNNLLDAFAHQAYPFDKLVDDLGIAHQQSRNPLFDVMVNFEHRDGRLEGEATQGMEAVSRFDLSVHFTRYANGIVIALTYNTQLFNEERIKTMAMHLEQSLKGLCEQSASPVEQLSVLTPAEWQKIDSFNDTAKDFGAPVCMAQLFEAQVQQTPGALAVQFGQTRLTYAELNASANKLAHYLRTEYNIGAGDFIGLMMNRTERMIIAVVAILKAGGAYVPLDPAYPADRCRYMANDSGIKLLLADEGFGNWHEGEVLVWNPSGWKACSANNPDCITTAEDAAYIIYTSGSTGKPKGVVIKQSSLYNLCCWLKGLLYEKEQLIATVTASISFDASVKQLFPPLASGAALQVVSEEERTNPVTYTRALQQGGAGVADVTPSFLQLVLQTIKENPAYAIPSLKYVLAGGETLQPETIRLFHELLPQATLINVYGPTETCVDATYKIMAQAPLGYLTSIGKPLPNVQVHITDEFLQPVPIGVFGQLLVGGAGLAKGYHGQPELTAAKFIEHPRQGRLYCTGDLGRWNAHGEIEFYGRRDAQVKMRGYRIEITEIENTITAHHAVKDAAVVYTNTQGNEALNAFIVWKNEPATAELQQHLLQHLPAYMVPSSLHSLEQLPKAPGGKIDRKLLAGMSSPTTNEPNSNYTAPRTEHEKLLVQIWEELLGQTPIGIDDDFWQRGGHSLKAMRMMVMIFSTLKVEVSIRDIFESRTIRKLAALTTGQSTTEYVTIAKVQDNLPAYPLSHAQKRLWIIHQVEEQLTAYNIVHAYTVPNSFDPQAFTRAVHYLAQRHEILRTVFAEIDGSPMQCVLKEMNIEVNFIDDAGLDSILQLENNRVFDLQNGPLFNLTVIKEADVSHCVLNMHHIISDAWSINIFKRELEAAYQAFANNTQPLLQPLSFQYKDYSAWLNTKNLDSSRDYWQQQLQGELPVLDMPIDLPRPARKTYAGRQSNLALPAGTMDRVRLQCAQYGCSSFSFLYACLNAFLHRYTHQQDLITGVALAGRDRVELHDQLGFYVNVLPARVQLQPDFSFEQLLRQVQELLVQQLAHQLYPFDQLVEDLNVKKDLSRSPVFDVLVNHHRYDVPAGDLSFSLQTDGESSFSKYDLSFDFVEFTDAALVSLSYNTDLFLPSTADRMLLYFEELLNDALLHPARQLHQLNFVPDAEQSMIAEVFNDTACALPGKTVIELLEQQAVHHAAVIALETADASLTYQQLNGQVNQAAHFLRSVYGIHRGHRVGVMLERSERMVLAIYAILKSGAAYVPIDPAYPLQRKLFMIHDSEVRLVITEKDFGAGIGCAFINWEAIPLQEHSTANPVLLNSAIDPAYMIYTSGSTGKPKGVIVQHKALANLCQWYREFITGLDDGVLKIYLHASINFDVSVGQLFGTMASGCTLLVSAEETKADPHRLVAFLQKHAATVMDITPSYLQVLLLHLQQSSTACPLRFVLAAGEVLTADTCRLFSKVFGSNARLFNLYGPTEACVYSTVEEANIENGQYNTIGYPLMNVQLHVLDEHLRETGIGTWGQLFIGGAGLAAGYWKREELTKEKFIQHPHFGRLYRTGDIGRWNNMGTIEFRGRSDHQVKLRGFRIELGEVEQAIQSFAGINEVAVIFDAAEKQLIAFVVWRQQQAAQLKQFLAEQLPAHMIPARFVELNELPRSGSGKIDRAALQQQCAQLTRHALYKAPATHTEEKLLRVWQEILHSDGIGVDDNFFELGGHSLKAMRMVSAIYGTFGVKLSIRDVLLNPTPCCLAKCIDAKEVNTTGIAAIPDAELYAPSPGQQSIWFAAQHEGGLQAYNMVMRYSWSCNLDLEAYKRAWVQLLQRHEILRTVFTVRRGQLWQQVKNEVEPVIEFEDLRNQHANWQQQVLDGIHQRQQEHAFDLACGPLIRTVAVPLAENKVEVFINIHHIVCDAWSVNIIARDLQELYEANLTNRAPQLPALKIQYRDFAAWQNSSLQDEHKKYWNELLNGPIALPELPTDFARPAVKSFAGNTITHAITGQQLQLLNEVCRAQQCSLFTLLTACMNLLLYRYTSTHEIITGIPVAGREAAELQDGIGYYVNMLPLKTTISGNESFGELIKLVKTNLLNAYQHQSYPVEAIAGKPLFNVVLNYDASERAGSIEPGEVAAVSKFDLSVHFSQFSNGITIAITYSTALFSAHRIQRLLQHLVQLISTAKDILAQPVDGIRYFPPAELELVTATFNQTSLPYEKDKTISALVEMQAKRTPGAAAVCCDDRVLTYGSLNAAANQLAHYLRNHYNIQPGDRVGLIMDRSERMVVALLAILKSGAAYVPMDPAYPAARCAYMQQDSGMQLLIAEKEYGAWSKSPVLLWEAAPWQHEKDHDLPQLHTADGLVYIIYTSGSTGQPKGVRISHRSLHNLCAWHAHAFEVTGGSCATLYAGIGFDAAAWELWPYLVSGATVHAINDDLRFNLQSFANYLGEHSITHCFLPTPACEELLRSKISLPPGLRLLTGGDRLRVLPGAGVKLFNNYGPTECTVVATSTLLQAGPQHAIPIGKPVSNTRIFIFDKNLRPVPVGIYGEMYIAGDSLAQGYHNKPELTAERFIDHPLTNERMFRTGDFARWLPNGEIDFLGRIDNQVKVRGYRVEVAEVEQAIARNASVNNVRVVVDKSTPDTRLIGFYEGSIEPSDLQLFLQQQLPAYMSPSQLLQVEQWPLTANGKIDDQALLELATASAAHTEAQEPLTEREQQLADAWQQVIGLQPHRNDNFFHLGGHSVKAMQLIHLVEKQMGVTLGLREIYNHPSLAAMAAAAGAVQRGLAISLNKADASLPVLYMLPPIAGSATIYTSLAQQLNGSYQCIGLQYPGLEQGEFAKSIEGTAKEFFQEIVQRNDNNVSLLGYSLGALAAFETAKLLEAAGKSVQLILIDRQPVHQQQLPVETFAAIAEQELASWMPDVNYRLAERIKALVTQNLHNLNAYTQAGSIAANILAFNAAAGNQQMQHWQAFTAGTVTCHTLPGHHYNLLACGELVQHLQNK
jgi:tyrocidine synthetase III